MNHSESYKFPRQIGPNLQVPSNPKNTYQECPTIDLDAIFDFENDCVNTSILRKNVLAGSLRCSPFRSLIWMILLQVIPSNRISNWKKDLKSKRLLYEQFISFENKKTIGELYQETETIINQDIERTHPKLNFFKDEGVRKTMRNILLAFSTRQSFGYRQGMHEILAVLIFAFHHHQATHFHALENDKFLPKIKEILSLFHSDQIIEADLYFTFNRIMLVIYDWYIVKDEFIDGVPHQYSPGVRYIEDIYHKHLPLYSKDLYDYMEKLGIAPITYGLKWTRLFFAQEFTFSDVLYIWDAIFSASEREKFPLVRYIFISLLLCFKDAIMIKDFSDALCMLMRIPQEIDVMSLIKLALHLYKPSVYKKPEIASIITASFLKTQKVNHLSRSVPSGSTINRSKSMKGFQSFQLFNRQTTSDALNPQSKPPITPNAAARRTSFMGTPSFMNSFMELFLPSTQDGSRQSKDVQTDFTEDYVLIKKDQLYNTMGSLRKHLKYLKNLPNNSTMTYQSSDSGASLSSTDTNFELPEQIQNLEEILQLYESCIIKSQKPLS